MKLSIIIPVLNSHEIVRRQILYFKAMPLPISVELIIVDDGSDPVIIDDTETARIIYTNDTRPWTQPRARNIGAKNATGEFLLFTDIDHIVTKDAIRFGLDCKYDYARFRRELAVLDESGVVTQDRDILEQYGIGKDKSLRVGCHTLSMVVRSSVFEQTGGFREKIGKHPTHDDGDMKHKLKPFTKCPDNDPDERALIYVIPNGRFSGDKNCNPLGLFHDLQR